MQHFKKTNLIYLFFFILFTGCSLKEDSTIALAPKDIRGFVIGFTSKEVNVSKNINKDDSFFLNKDAIFTFNENDVYTTQVNNEVVMEGNFSYRRLNNTISKIVTLYSNSNGEQTYTFNLSFLNKKEGTWEGSFGNGNLTIERGTFRILKDR